MTPKSLKEMLLDSISTKARTVDEALESFRKIVADLREVAQLQGNLVAMEEGLIDDATKRLEIARVESSRAFAMAKKIEALIEET